MRQWWKMVALGSVITLIVAIPAVASGSEGDDAPRGTTARVMEQDQERVGQPAVGEREMEQHRQRVRLHEGPGTCDGDCDADRTQQRRQLQDGSGEGCDGTCDGDQTRQRERDQLDEGGCDGDGDREQLRQRLQDCEAGARAAWEYTRRHGWATHVAV